MALKDKFNFETSPLYVMDASAFIFKGFYGNMRMTRGDGFPTGAIYTVARILLKLLKEEKPKYFSFIKDGKGPNFRHEVYPLYKANRQSTPEELVMQFEPIEELVKALGLHMEISSNCEADDCIASLVNSYKKERNIVIVGIDKDLRQCLDTNVLMWDPSGKEQKIVTLESFRESTGLEPHQWADIQAIIGDSSDNIPGIRGIGEKTAEKIFKEFPTLEDIRDNFENLPKTVKAKFEGNLDAMFMYRELTSLKTDCCQHITKENLEVKPLDLEACMTFFRTYEMPSLQREIGDLAKKGLVQVLEQSAEKTEKNTKSEEVVKEKKSSQSSGNQMSLFDMFDSPQEEKKEIESRKDLPKAKGKNIALLEAYQVERNSTGFYIATENEEFRYIGDKSLLSEFLTEFESIVCVDYKSLIKNNNAIFTNLTTKILDISLFAYLLNPEQRDYSWSKISTQFRDKTRNISFDTPSTLVLALKDIFIKEVGNANLMNLYKSLELPLVPVLANMEQKGIVLDTKRTDDFLVEVQKDLEKITSEIYSIAGKEFNIRSAQQTGDILFNHLALPISGKTKGGQMSTSQDALEKLIGKHPIIDLLLDYRKLEKLRSTYLEPLPKLIDKDGRIHTSFNQMATATGRLSSSNPNLQNIPIRGELGQRVRSCFVAEEEHLLISADYSQIELRVLAHYSQEPTLLDAFKNDEDIHRSTAALLNNVALADVTTEQRQAAKTINFGLLYGMGARKLAQDIKVSTKEAQTFIETYFDRFKGIKSFYDRTLVEANEKGYVVTIAGRRRLLPDLSSTSRQAQALAERQAINTLIQGSAADIIKLAMLAVYNDEELKSYKADFLLQVHDELILSVPKENAEKAGERLAYLMSAVQTEGGAFAVPLKVEYAAAQNWLQAH